MGGDIIFECFCGGEALGTPVLLGIEITRPSPRSSISGGDTTISTHIKKRLEGGVDSSGEKAADESSSVPSALGSGRSGVA